MGLVRKHIAMVLGMASALIVSGSALAFTMHGTGRKDVAVDPFQGISAVARPTGGQSTLDPTTSAEIQSLSADHAGTALAAQILSEARALPTTVNGNKIWLIPTKTGELCLFFRDLEGCTQLMSRRSPAMFVVNGADASAGGGATAFGVAMDGVTSVSFTVGDKPQSVPVTQNVFEFQGVPGTSVADFSVPVVTFADGTSVRLP